MKQKLHDLIDAVIAKNQDGQRLTFGWTVTYDGTYCVSVHDQDNGCKFIGSTVYLAADLNELHGTKIEDLIKEINKL